MANAVQDSNEDIVEEGVTVYLSEDGNRKLYATRDGKIFHSSEEVSNYVAVNAIDIAVNEFMDGVDKDPARYFANKKGVMPTKERALMALKTRLRNNAKHVLAWYLQG